MSRLSGTEGYGKTADALVERYDSLTFEHVHRSTLDLLPAPPARALDIGAGTGRDAAALAARGYMVVAAEPTAKMRANGQHLHVGGAIEWIDDGLPDLATVRAKYVPFDLVMMTAVWMHLDAEQRARAMPAVAGLVKTGGILTMSLRHGPVPEGRRMFDVSAAETSALAAWHGLETIHHTVRDAITKAIDVTWDILALRKL